MFKRLSKKILIEHWECLLLDFVNWLGRLDFGTATILKKLCRLVLFFSIRSLKNEGIIMRTDGVVWTDPGGSRGFPRRILL